MGDQRGNVHALMDAAGVLDGLPYRLEWSEFAAAAPLAEAMAAEAVDGGNIGDAPFTFAVAGGVPIRAIATDRANPEGTAILVTAASPVQGFADLHGKRIATGKGSVGHSLVLAALRRQGWTPADVQLVFLLPSDAKAALASGVVDAWSTWEPYTSQIEVLEGGRRVVSGAGITPGLGFQAATVAAIAAKRDALSDFVRRLAEARRWQQANVNRYAASWAKLMDFPDSVPEHWFARARDRIVETDDGVFRDLQRVIDLYADAGLLRHRFQAADAFDSGFNDAVRAGNSAS
ncbi:MAG: aliphatic sulfonate ABC transporter substrate-binding protein [Acetobacteraceae bacterium]|nr:aliphatic sulfonate ABC transporter substrate-binding protein [Acetobacteraceae bacterium]